MSVLVPWKAEEGARSPGAVVIGGHESPYLVWMLGTEPESSKKEGSALSHRVISPDPFLLIFFETMDLQESLTGLEHILHRPGWS